MVDQAWPVTWTFGPRLADGLSGLLECPKKLNFPSHSVNPNVLISVASDCRVEAYY